MADPSLNPAIKDILNFEGLSAEDFSNATGSGFNAAGAALEESGYKSAEEIAKQNESLELISGNIQNMQTQREVRSTIGSQRAQISAAGFGDSGSALLLAKSSRQQGYLQQQITGLQASIAAGGSAEQVAAAETQANAAGVSNKAALALQAEQQKQGALLQSYATAEANAVDALTSSGTAGTGPTTTFNGVNWVTTPGQPGAATGTKIASTVAAGRTLSPGDLTAAALAEAGAPGTAGNPSAPLGRRFNGVSWS